MSDQTADSTQLWQDAATTAESYHSIMQMCWLTGAKAYLDIVSAGVDVMASPTRTAVSTAIPAKQIGECRSWYRQPVENPFLTIMDDALRPWRTFMPNPMSAGGGLDPFRLAGEIGNGFSAFHSPSGFAAARIEFPDSRQMQITVPTPWAFWSAFVK